MTLSQMHHNSRTLPTTSPIASSTISDVSIFIISSHRCTAMHMCCSVLQCGAVLYSVLQSVVACHFDVSKSVLPHTIAMPCICVAVSH